MYGLGRLPSVPDERDFKLEDLVTATDPLEAALNVLLSSRAAASTKAWATIATARILGTTPPLPAPTPGDVTWPNSDATLDQGQYGTCVGNGWADWSNTNKASEGFDEGPFGVEGAALNGGNHARAVYYEATVIDGQPDDPDVPNGGQQGSTVRSGAKAMKNRGLLAVYAFTTSQTTIEAWLDAKGSLVVGTNWTSDMFTPDTHGYVTPTGAVDGGHCYSLCGDIKSEDAFLFQNSWGKSWGLGGSFKMKKADFMQLVAGGGEVCSALELK